MLPGPLGPGRDTHARQVKGYWPDKAQSAGPPGLEFCTGPTTDRNINEKFDICAGRVSGILVKEVKARRKPLPKSWQPSSEDHVAANGAWRKKCNRWEDLEQYSSHGEGLAEVEGPRCCPTRHPA